jgi:hypothetical protein
VYCRKSVILETKKEDGYNCNFVGFFLKLAKTLSVIQNVETNKTVEAILLKEKLE